MFLFYIPMISKILIDYKLKKKIDIQLKFNPSNYLKKYDTMREVL